MRKLCLQHKSNANILANSPYFTNRTHQHQIAASLAPQHPLDPRKGEQIRALFQLEEQALSGLQGLESVAVRVRLQIMGSIVELEKEARNIQ